MGFTEPFKLEYYHFEKIFANLIVKKLCLALICISFGYIFYVNIWRFFCNVFCHFSLLTFLLYISSMFLSSVFTLSVQVTAVPSLIARIRLATLLGKAGATFFFYKPSCRPFKAVPELERIVFVCADELCYWVIMSLSVGVLLPHL